MAKLKDNFTAGKPRLPGVAGESLAGSSGPKVSIPKDSSGQTLKLTTAGSVVQALSFGSLHTKTTGSSAGSQWGGLLNAATSGGASSLISGGVLSTGVLGFVGKLLGLFGGSKSTPAAPTPFVMPASQITSLNIGSPGGTSAVSLGVQSNVNSGSQSGPIYQQSGSSGTDHATQSAQVVSIVKQALLTSSSLNDVISEI